MKRCNVISVRCKEQYLADTKEGQTALLLHHLASGGISRLRSPYSIYRENYQEHVILFTLAGVGYLETDKERFDLKAGTVCLIPSGTTYRYWTVKFWSVTWFHLPPLSHWEGVARTVSRHSNLGGEEITTLMKLFLNERSRAKSDTVYILDSLARILALLVDRELTRSEFPRHGEQGRRLENLRQSLYRQPERAWSVGLLAAEFGFSSRNLQKQVNRIFGIGVMEMVTKVRMEKASSLLVTTEFKLDDIAAQVGYENSFAFSRAFKRYSGQSPLHYRNFPASRKEPVS